MRTKKVTVIGGGTGTFVALSGLVKYPLDISVIVSMMDDGGSNRVIRDEFGLLPTSDLRQCMVALADENENELLRKLFTYRYSSGVGISGMTFGNLFMAALTDIYNSQEKAIEETCKILHVKGKIVPVTFSNSHLVARYENGKQVLGEHAIDEPDEKQGNFEIVDLELIPKAKANPKAIKAIKDSDVLVIGPGDLFTSVLPNIIVDGIAKAIRNSKAKKVYVVNLMTRFGQTNDFTAKDHVDTVQKFLGGEELDYCLVNTSKNYPKGILKRYREEKATPTKDDLGKGNGYKVIRRNFISSKVYKKPISDKLKRSLIRHDSDKLAKVIYSLI
ncbi:uridine diphosphate-N-acetylglucosamine-binding protein YvcK [Patescibacteria group bacterium]